MPGTALTADKPLNVRQELFCQTLARGMSIKAAYREAGFKNAKGVWMLLKKANVRARIAELLAEAAALSLVSRAQITQRILGFVEKAEAGGSAAMVREGRQGLMDVAKLNGMVNPLPPAPPKREPITEIRRVVVEPNGDEWEY